MSAVLSRTLKYTLPMMQGEDVRALQSALALQGALHRTGVDGLFGPGTKRAVEVFQRQQGLSVDGIVGPNTQAAIAPLLRGEAPTPAAAKGGKVPADWMPPADMRRIILHWTGGLHSPSEAEKKHYHILIDGEGGLHRGKMPITANVPPLKRGKYAAHTLNANGRSIGVSLCAMGGDVREKPFAPGPFPITRAQWEALAQVAAELCLRYGIPVTRKTVLGHGEVQANLEIEQTGKWDPLAVPWDPGRPYPEVGDSIRARTQDILDGLTTPSASREAADPGEEEVPPSETIWLDGTGLRGAAFNGRMWLDLDHLVAHMGWPAPVIDDAAVSALIAEPALRFGIVQTGDADGFKRRWVEAAEVSEKLEWALREDEAGDVHLSSAAPKVPEQVVVKRGQTLGHIAQQHLGDAQRWRDLRDENGALFDEQSARRLKVGAIVLLPDGTDAAKTAPSSPGTKLTSKQITEIAGKIARLEGGGSSMQKTRSSAVEAILRVCVAEKVNDLSHQAYILATAYHETNLGQFMSELWGPTAAQKTYGQRLGNRGDADGKRYRGRGFVQITGRDNYRKYGEIFGQDFLGHPELVAEPDTAAQILVRGLCEIGFTGRKLLADMGFDGDFDWFNARSLVNGDKNLGGDSRYPGLTKGEGVAQKGRKYREIIATT